MAVARPIARRWATAGVASGRIGVFDGDGADHLPVAFDHDHRLAPVRTPPTGAAGATAGSARRPPATTRDPAAPRPSLPP